jgi:urease accessory protein
VQPRAIGTLRVSSAKGPNGAALKDLHQSGSLKVLFPRVADSSDLLGVYVNTAGGITGGDRFVIEGLATADSRMTLTTQAAERIYRAKGSEVGSLATHLNVEANARLDWLPQETILYNHCALRRNLRIDIATGATTLMVEPLVFGRITMGERLRQIQFTDNVRVYRDGNLVFADATRLIGDAYTQLSSAFTAAGMGAGASILYAAPDADLYLSHMRDLAPELGGVSLIRPGILFARILAPDSYELRKSLIPMIERLRGADLPKTWTL